MELTPKEKAIELFDKMCQTISDGCEHNSYCDDKECRWKGIVYCKMSQNEAKQCASISVDEIVNELPDMIDGYFVDNPLVHTSVDNIRKQFWQQVKEEINNL